MKTWFASFIFTAITSCLVLFANFEYKLGGGSHATSLILMAIFWSADFIWLIIILISKAKNNYQKIIVKNHLTINKKEQDDEYSEMCENGGLTEREINDLVNEMAEDKMKDSETKNWTNTEWQAWTHNEKELIKKVLKDED